MFDERSPVSGLGGGGPEGRRGEEGDVPGGGEWGTWEIFGEGRRLEDGMCV